MLPAYAPLIGSAAQQGAATAPSYIFYTGLESGDISDFDGTSLGSGNTIAASTGAPYAGTYDMVVSLGTANNRCYAYKNFSDLTEFWFLGVVRLGASYGSNNDFDAATMFEFWDGASEVLSLAIRQHDTNGLRWQLYDHNRASLVNGPYNLALSTNYAVEVHWKAGSGDGVIEVHAYTPGTTPPITPLYSVTNASSSGVAMDQLRAGTRNWFNNGETAILFDAGSAISYDEMYVSTTGRIGPI